MRVREWIEALSEMNPDWEVMAKKEGSSDPAVPVQPVEAQSVGGNIQASCAPFVRVVKDQP